MELQKYEIVDIPPNRIRYFGGSNGKMLLPSPMTIASMIKRIPESKLITTDLLRRELTQQFNVQGTCPVTTKKSLRSLANGTRHTGCLLACDYPDRRRTHVQLSRRIRRSLLTLKR